MNIKMLLLPLSSVGCHNVLYRTIFCCRMMTSVLAVWFRWCQFSLYDADDVRNRCMMPMTSVLAVWYWCYVSMWASLKHQIVINFWKTIKIFLISLQFNSPMREMPPVSTHTKMLSATDPVCSRTPLGDTKIPDPVQTKKI